jgi:hypothetical protein
MTKKIIAPWLEMYDNSQRRINDSIHNIFWIKDDKGRYGLMLQFPDGFNGQISEVKLQGLFTIVRKRGEIVELYIILKNSEDLEMFNLLCGDLTLSAFNCKRADKLFNVIVNRLLRWQAFLSKSIIYSLSEPLQMGLFSELLFLMDFLFPIFGKTIALQTWTGPDNGKKDFSTDYSFIEVKSLISSFDSNILCLATNNFIFFSQS